MTSNCKNSNLFNSYAGIIGQARDIYQCTEHFLNSFLDTAYGEKFCLEGFDGSLETGYLSTLAISEKDADLEYDTKSRITISIYSSGHIYMCNGWYKENSGDIGDEENFEIHFSSTEKTEDIAARIVAGLQRGDNAISRGIFQFLIDQNVNSIDNVRN